MVLLNILLPNPASRLPPRDLHFAFYFKTLRGHIIPDRNRIFDGGEMALFRFHFAVVSPLYVRVVWVWRKGDPVLAKLMANSLSKRPLNEIISTEIRFRRCKCKFSVSCMLSGKAAPRNTLTDTRTPDSRYHIFKWFPRLKC